MSDDDLKLLLGRIDGRTESMVDSINKTNEWMIQQDNRIRDLEACKNQAYGVAAVLGVIGGAIFELIVFIRGLFS